MANATEWFKKEHDDWNWLYRLNDDSNPPSYSYDKAGEQLTRNGYHWAGEAPTVTYSFGKQDHFASDDNIEDPYELTDQQKVQARLSFQSWSDVAHITFKEVESDGDIQLANVKVLKNGGSAVTDYYYNTQTKALNHAHVWLGSQAKDPALDNFARETLTHEIGHAIGLSHPAVYDVSDSKYPEYSTGAVYREDDLQYTVMSYFDETNTGASFSSGKPENFPSGPQLHDIAAAQHLYGANPNTFVGDTIYGFNSNTGRDYLSAHNGNDVLIFSVWDGGGTDTFDFSGYAQDQNINIQQQAFSNIGGHTRNISIAKDVDIENIISGSGNDTLSGNQLDNTITGGKGGDSMTGGDGADTFVFNSVEDSLSDNPDVITDFVSGMDKFDFTRIVGINHDNLIYDHSADEGISTLLAENIDGHDFAIGIVGEVNIDTDVLFA